MSGTGMASDDNVHGYVDATASTAVSSMSAQDRAEALMGEVNNLLGQQGVPHIGYDWNASGNTYGTFDASSWTMSLNHYYFDENSHDANTLEHNYQEALQTVFHEARHAEQTFRCLREVIGLGATPEQALHAMQAGSAPVPPQWVAEQAAHNPILQCDVSQNEAAQWYESMYGSGAAHRTQVLTDPNAPYSDYRNLPEEADAWNADGAVGDQYNQQMHPSN